MASKGNSRIRRIVWAVDPLEKSLDAARSSAWMLRSLTRKGDAVVLPIFIWGGSASEEIPDPKSWSAKGFRKFALERIASILSRVKIRGLADLYMPSAPASGISEGVRMLLDYARKHDADLIVVATHARKGIQRWALGSFTETLALQSEIPIVSVHPNWRRVPEIDRILFATDFSSESREAFDQTLDFAVAHGSKLTLYHRIEDPTVPIFEMGFTAAYAIEKAREASIATSRAEAERWIAAARARKIEADVMIDVSRRGAPAEAIVRAADKLGAMIAMVSRSGSWVATLLGSTTRKVMRSSENPVWVIHPREKPASRKATRVQPKKARNGQLYPLV